MFLRDGTLLSQPFDVDQLRILGEPTALVERVGGSGSFGFFSVSTSGVLAYRTGFASAAGLAQLTWLDRKAQSLGTVGEPGPNPPTPGAVALSPDGARAVVTLSPATPSDLWLVEFARGITTRFTDHPAAELRPIWSPDGARIAFLARSGGAATGDVHLKNANGTGEETAILSAPEVEVPTDWSRDGRWLLFKQDQRTDSNQSVGCVHDR